MELNWISIRLSESSSVIKVKRKQNQERQRELDARTKRACPHLQLRRRFELAKQENKDRPGDTQLAAPTGKQMLSDAAAVLRYACRLLLLMLQLWQSSPPPSSTQRLVAR